MPALSRQRWPVARVAYAIAIASALSCAANSGCKPPSFGNQLETRQEKLIGAEAAAELEAQYPPVTDPAVTARVDAIAAKIVPEAQEERSDIDYHVKVLSSADIETVSLPGGWIFIDQGVLTLVGSDDDMLACVIAHEAAHEALRHPAQQLADALGEDQLVDLFTEGKYQDISNVALQLDQLSHSRDEEYAADRMGLEFAYRAGYDPEGLLRFFELLQSGPAGRQKPAWLITHPLSKNRALRAEQEVRRLKSDEPL